MIEELYKKKYYVYKHYIDGNLFYIGKGTGTRALDFLSRNKSWKNKVKGRYGDVEVVIEKSFDDETEALILESELINLNVKNGHLTNMVLKSNYKNILEYEKQTKEIIAKKINSIDKSYLNRQLTASEKRDLCEELNIINDRGTHKRWVSIKGILKKSGYKIKDETIRIDGKQMRVSTITAPKDN